MSEMSGSGESRELFTSPSPPEGRGGRVGSRPFWDKPVGDDVFPPAAGSVRCWWWWGDCFWSSEVFWRCGEAGAAGMEGEGARGDPEMDNVGVLGLDGE